MQLSFRKRFAHGLSLDTNYVWSKMLSSYDSSGWGSRNGTNTIQSSFDRNASYGLSNFDIPHARKGSVVYALPFGKGKLSYRPLDRVIGGWTFGSIMVWQSGAPFSILSGRGTLNRQAKSAARSGSLIESR